MSEDKNIHRSTSRVLDILELVAEHPSEYNLTDISKLMEAPKSSLYPIMYTLTARHFLALDNNGHYKVDFSLYQVGNSYLRQLNFLDEVEKILTNMTNVCMETSHFGILKGGDVLYLKKIDSPEPIRMTSRVGMRIPAYGTAIGKALLMDTEFLELKKLYPNGLKALTENTITDFTDLSNQLSEARLLGYTCEMEESTQYICCFAVPIQKRERLLQRSAWQFPYFATQKKGRNWSGRFCLIPRIK